MMVLWPLLDKNVEYEHDFSQSLYFHGLRMGWFNRHGFANV